MFRYETNPIFVQSIKQNNTAMYEGIKKKVIRDIRDLEMILTRDQEEMTEEEINEILEKLDILYELLKMFD